MHFVSPKIIFLSGLFLFLANVQSQTLEDRLSSVFHDLLELNLAGSPGQHGEHFKPANVASSQTIINSLNNFIGHLMSDIMVSILLNYRP